jgi:hypothetical protein
MREQELAIVGNDSDAPAEIAALSGGHDQHPAKAKSQFSLRVKHGVWREITTNIDDIGTAAIRRGQRNLRGQADRDRRERFTAQPHGSLERKAAEVCERARNLSQTGLRIETDLAAAAEADLCCPPQIKRGFDFDSQWCCRRFGCFPRRRRAQAALRLCRRGDQKGQQDRKKFHRGCNSGAAFNESLTTPWRRTRCRICGVE